MEHINIPTVCIKCDNILSDEEIAMGIPICQKCVGSLVGIVGKKIADTEMKRLKKQVENFSRFVVSSGQLMGLDDTSIAQSCFNIFMDTIVYMEDKDIVNAENIFGHAATLMNKELEKIKIKKDEGENINDQLTMFMDELMKKGGRDGDSKGDVQNEKDKYDKKEGDKNGREETKPFGKRIDVE